MTELYGITSKIRKKWWTFYKVGNSMHVDMVGMRCLLLFENIYVIIMI